MVSQNLRWVIINSHDAVRILRGANTSKLSNLNPTNKRRELVLLSALIEHPDVGLILYDAGCAEDLNVVCDSFTREHPDSH